MKQPGRVWEGPIIADIALFAIDPSASGRGAGSLAVVMAVEGDRLALPSTPLGERPTLESAAEEAIRQTIPQTDANVWPEPLIWQIEGGLLRDQDDAMRVGHTAVARLVDMPADGSLKLITANGVVGDQSLAVSRTDRAIIEKGLASLRDTGRMEWRIHAATGAQQNTLPIIARLLRDPQSFTIGELRQAFEAVLGEPLDPRNFKRAVINSEWMGLTPLAGPPRQGALGRPAGLWSLPSHVLRTLGERP